MATGGDVLLGRMSRIKHSSIYLDIHENIYNIIYKYLYRVHQPENFN